MDKDIVKYLHYYLGCEARVRHRYVDYEPGTWTVWEKLTIEHYGRLLNDFSIDGIQVELRKLESMTEEEMVELLLSMWPPEIDGKPDNDEYILDMFYNDGAVDVDGDVAVGANYSCRCYEGQIAIRQTGDIDLWDEEGKQERVVNITAAFHYLLSKGFDLFSLIESGAAINKDKQ